MNDLADVFVVAGCDDVQTFIQSGNVIFSTTAAIAKRLPSLVAASIAKRFGLQTPVIVRSAKEISEIVRKNPYLKQRAPEDSLHVMFLADSPDLRRVRDLDPHRSPPDDFVLRGSEVYLRLPNGAAKTKFTNAYFDLRLATTGTQRNWRTVLRLAEMLNDRLMA